MSEQSPPTPVGLLLRDGLYRWDGRQWQAMTPHDRPPEPIISPDGRQVWDGQQWQPREPAPAASPEGRMVNSDEAEPGFLMVARVFIKLLLAIALIPPVLWLLGFIVLPVGGSLIHILLIIVIIMVILIVILPFVQGRRSV